jgi:NitT/TauT family transport system ATP-binding protein
MTQSAVAKKELTMVPRSSASPVLQARRITKSYGSFKALDDVSLELRENQITAFVGPSGCGKTSMLRIIAGLEYPSRGSMEVFGKPITGPGPDRGMIFQAYTSFPWLTTLQNIEYGMKITGVPKDERRERAQSFLGLVHLEKFRDAYPKSLSGGMKQRVALARALAQNPSILLMDEPFGALDAQVRWEMQELMIELIEREQKTVVAITHDIEEAIYLADRIIFFTRQPGRIKADFELEFKKGKRYQHKEDLIQLPGYAEMEHDLFAMMREEIQKASE